MENFANSFRTALAEDCDASETTIVIASIVGAPSPDYRIRVGDELMLVTAHGSTSDPDYEALLQFEGSDTSTTITDEVGVLTWTAIGNAQIDTAQFKWGASSAIFDGTDDSIQSSDYVFTTAESWTIEGWVRFVNIGAAACGLVHIEPGDSYGLWFYVNSDSTIRNRVSDNGSSDNINADGDPYSVATVNNGQWYHWAAEYDAAADKFSLYWNGERTHQYSSTVGFNETKKIRLGGYYLSGVLYASLNGWMDGVRLMNTAVYAGTASFTPPAAAFDNTLDAINVTVTRGVEGTTGAAHVTDDVVEHVLTAGGIAQWIADRYTPL